MPPKNFASLQNRPSAVDPSAHPPASPSTSITTTNTAATETTQQQKMIDADITGVIGTSTAKPNTENSSSNTIANTNATTNPPVNNNNNTSTTTTAISKAPSTAAAPAKKAFREDTLVTFAPHVTLVKRTFVDAAGQALAEPQPITFVRKVIQAPERAARELEHLRAQCRHPNVLKYLWGQKHRSGVVDIDMEFADGGQLDSVLSRVTAGVNRVRAAKCCARQVLSGLVYYNQVHGRCHRDVKPANFLVRCDGVIKVSDFDVSKETSFSLPGNNNQGGNNNNNVAVSNQHGNNNQNHNSAGGGGGGGGGRGENTVLGTAPYMSPELVLGALNVSPMLSDMWSVGVTLFQLLEGQLPFAKFKFGSFNVPTNDHIMKLSWNVVGEDRALEYLLRRCLTIAPEERITLSEATALTFVMMAATDPAGTDDTDPWSNGYADAEDENVKAAKELKVLICDDVIRANRCVPPKYAAADAAQKACLVYDVEEYEAVKVKIGKAADAVRDELKSWKEVRAVAELRDKVDRAMKEVCRLRCQKVWNQLVEVAPWLKNS